MSQDPYTGSYHQPQHPYSHGMPPHNTQQEQQQVLYAMPASSGSQHQQQNYDGPPPQPTSPQPFAQAIQELLRQYLKVLTKPSESTFSQEMGKASWYNTGVLAAISVIMLIIIIIAASWHLSLLDMQLRAFISVLITAGCIIAIIVFIGSGIRYLLARAFRGQGTFLAQWYT